MKSSKLNVGQSFAVLMIVIGVVGHLTFNPVVGLTNLIDPTLFLVLGIFLYVIAGSMEWFCPDSPDYKFKEVS